MLSRRILLAALLPLLACTGERGGAATGGVLVIVTPGDADNLFPPVSGSQTSRHVQDRIFMRLADLGQSLNTLDDSGFAPALAARWEHRDSVTLVFHMDARARWHDGTKVTAHDVAFTFGVYTNPDVGAPARGDLAAIHIVQATDDSTVAFGFTRAYPEQLYDATYHMRILPKHLLDSIPPAALASSAFASAPVGNGPYRFVRWTRDERIELAADSTWFKGAPHLTRIVWRIMPDVAAAVSALIAGEADAIETIPLRIEIERAQADSNLRLVPYPSPFLAGIVFNLRRPLFASRDLRRALAMAVDRGTVVRSVFGPFADVPVGAAAPMQWIASLPVRQLPFDTTAAARLLDSLGWRRGAGGMRARGGRPLRFELLVPSTSRARQQAAVLVQSQLRAAGVDVVVEVVDFAVLNERGHDGAFEALFFSRTLDASPAVLVSDWSSQGIGGVNIGAYADPAFDSLITAAVRAPDRARAAPLYQAALERANDDVPAIFAFAPRNNAVLHHRYENVTIRSDDWLASVAQWSIPPGRRLPRDGTGPAAP